MPICAVIPDASSRAIFSGAWKQSERGRLHSKDEARRKRFAFFRSPETENASPAGPEREREGG